MGATTEKTPTTFRELDTNPRDLSPLFVQARHLAASHPELTEAECVGITLGVRQHRFRHFTPAGMWTLTGDSERARIILLPGDKPARGDAQFVEPEEAP